MCPAPCDRPFWSHRHFPAQPASTALRQPRPDPGNPHLAAWRAAPRASVAPQRICCRVLCNRTRRGDEDQQTRPQHLHEGAAREAEVVNERLDDLFVDHGFAFSLSLWERAGGGAAESQKYE